MPHPLNFRRTRESIPLGRRQLSCGTAAVAGRTAGVSGGAARRQAGLPRHRLELQLMCCAAAGPQRPPRCFCCTRSTHAAAAAVLIRGAGSTRRTLTVIRRSLWWRWKRLVRFLMLFTRTRGVTILSPAGRRRVQCAVGRCPKVQRWAAAARRRLPPGGRAVPAALPCRVLVHGRCRWRQGPGARRPAARNALGAAGRASEGLPRRPSRPHSLHSPLAPPGRAWGAWGGIGAAAWLGRPPPGRLLTSYDSPKVQRGRSGRGRGACGAVARVLPTQGRRGAWAVWGSGQHWDAAKRQCKSECSDPAPVHRPSGPSSREHQVASAGDRRAPGAAGCTHLGAGRGPTPARGASAPPGVQTGRPRRSSSAARRLRTAAFAAAAAAAWATRSSIWRSISTVSGGGGVL